MLKFGIIFLLTAISAVVFGNSNQKVLDLNYKFQAADVEKFCLKNEVISECFKKQVRKLHEKEKLNVEELIGALPAGKGLILKEKEKQQKAKTKLSNAELNLSSHKKQADFALFLLELSCTAKVSASAQKFLKTLKSVTTEQIEQVRKYSAADAADLQMKFDTTLLCEKKN
ncbi:MAG: hypothetical protein V4654_03325 [Bdellovibrionota bacterium]